MSDSEQKEKFEKDFLDRFESIVARGAKIDFTLTHICRATGIGRATPERWRKKTPMTVRLIDEMEAAVVQAEKEWVDSESE